MPGPVFIPKPATRDPDRGGPSLLRMARQAISSGGLDKALEYALGAARSLEKGAELAEGLRVLAAVYSGMGRVEEAVPVLERAVEASGSDSDALGRFAGLMQLGDAHSVMGRLEQAISCYGSGLRVQIDALGQSDPRVAETYRYLAEAHMQAMQLDEAEDLCRKTLEIHRSHSPAESPEEVADHRLLALILEAKGDYESALECLVLASTATLASGNADPETAAAIDIGIGNAYLCLCRFDEAVFAYKKALAALKSSRGADNHPSVASVLVRLADLYHRTGMLRESKSCCEAALRIYAKPSSAAEEEAAASGLTEISAIYESLGEPEEALRLLQRATKLLARNPAHRCTVAGLEAQTGVMLYMLGRYKEARGAFESAVAKLRADGERKSAFFGIVLNQMGLACVQLYRIGEAARLFEEAREILEQECGPCHLDTLGVYSNLAAAYDAMGRVEDAIEILEYIMKVREEKLGTANPDVDDEKKRLAQLLKEVGRSRNRKGTSLESLLGCEALGRKKEGTKKWPGFGFKI